MDHIHSRRKIGQKRLRSIALTQCEFCMKAQTAVAAHIYQHDEFVASVLRDPEASPLDEKEMALLLLVRPAKQAASLKMNLLSNVPHSAPFRAAVISRFRCERIAIRRAIDTVPPNAAFPGADSSDVLT